MTATPEQSAIAANDMPSAADRLMTALATLTQRASTVHAATVTVAELCRLAGVSRNSLYRHHPAALKALHEYQHERRTSARAAARISAQLRSENALLQQKLAKFAALVDHYYGAYREARSLLDRRERELAELRRRLDLKPITLRS